MTEEQKKEYAVIIENGINLFEGLQERQDACVKINVLFNQDMWCSLSEENVKYLIRITKLGLLDVYSMPNIPNFDNPEVKEEFYRIIQGEVDIET